VLSFLVLCRMAGKFTTLCIFTKLLGYIWDNAFDYIQLFGLQKSIISY